MLEYQCSRRLEERIIHSYQTNNNNLFGVLNSYIKLMHKITEYCIKYEICVDEMRFMSYNTIINPINYQISVFCFDWVILLQQSCRIQSGFQWKPGSFHIVPSIVLWDPLLFWGYVDTRQHPHRDHHQWEELL